MIRLALVFYFQVYEINFLILFTYWFAIVIMKKSAPDFLAHWLLKGQQA